MRFVKLSFFFPDTSSINSLMILIFLLLIAFTSSISSQSKPVGPGEYSFDEEFITGEFIDWDRSATPKLVLRVHGAGMLQTFSDISPDGKFKLPLPEVPAGKNFGTKWCGDFNKGHIIVVSDFSLLTTLSGFTSPGRWDSGYSQIGMAVLSDEYFSKNIGKPGGKRAYWLFSEVPRTVDAGECNNKNSFEIAKGWNAFTLIVGKDGGPHTYEPGLDNDLGWYWYAFSEDINQSSATDTLENSNSDKEDEESPQGDLNLKADWLIGKWDGVQVDVKIKMHIKPSGDVWLESIENNKTKSLDGKWTLKNGEFILEITEGTLKFNIEKTSENGFRLFGKDASSEILFTRSN